MKKNLFSCFFNAPLYESLFYVAVLLIPFLASSNAHADIQPVVACELKGRTVDVHVIPENGKYVVTMTYRVIGLSVKQYFAAYFNFSTNTQRFTFEGINPQASVESWGGSRNEKVNLTIKGQMGVLSYRGETLVIPCKWLK